MPATSLREFQRQMKARIQPRTTDTSMPTPSLDPQRGTPGVERLAVYADGYLARIQESLAEVYEALAHLLGPSAFHELAQAYARAHPSHDYNLSFAGRHLPEFLPAWPATHALPFLPDLARLEWTVCEAFHAFEQPPYDPAPLVAMPPEAWASVQLMFQPSVRVVGSAWPILDLWAARTTPHERMDLEVVGRPQQVLVHRPGARVRCELLDAPQAQALTALLGGDSLGALCESLARSADANVPLHTWCARWATDGLIAGIQRLRGSG